MCVTRLRLEWLRAMWAGGYEARWIDTVDVVETNAKEPKR
jgi:hypothetical protein